MNEMGATILAHFLSLKGKKLGLWDHHAMCVFVCFFEPVDRFSQSLVLEAAPTA